MLTVCKIAVLFGVVMGSGSQSGPPEPVAGVNAPSRAGFSLGAGDALGAQIRVNDEILARRLGVDRVQFATVPSPD